MSRARYPLSLVSAGLGLSLALASGCGSSQETVPSEAGGAHAPTAPIGARVRSCTGAVGGTGHLRVTGVGCAVGRGIVAAWTRRATCAAPSGSSRSACAIVDYHCQAVATPSGLAVNCARPSRSISFRAKRR